MPTNRLMLINIRKNRSNKMVLTLMPRMSLNVINRLVTNVTQRRQHYARAISLRQRRLSRTLSQTNNLLPRYGTTHSSQMLSNNTRTNKQTIRMTRVNHTTTSRPGSLLRKNTNSLNRLLRTSTRRQANITNRFLPNHKRSVTKSSTPRSLTHHKRRGTHSLINRNPLHHKVNEPHYPILIANNNSNNNSTHHKQATKQVYANIRTNSRALRINMVSYRILRVVRRAMLPRITNRVIRSRTISLTDLVSNMMTSIQATRYSPQ